VCQKLLQVAAKSASCHALVTESPQPPHPGEAWAVDKMEKIKQNAPLYGGQNLF
jgi:hypothetical protein